jgi:hypothetical protein
MTIRWLSRLAKSALEKVLNRDLVLLPRAPNGRAFGDPRGSALLPLAYTYRADDGKIGYKIHKGGDTFRYQLHTLEWAKGQAVPGKPCLSFALEGVKPGDCLRVNLLEPAAWINGSRIPSAAAERPSARKFLAHLQLAQGPNHWARACPHYLPFANKAIGKDYFFGDDYADYPRQTDSRSALDLVRRHVARGRLLDVGCALGIYTKAFLDAGFDAYGIDVSEFAVTEAMNLVGAGRVARCNLDESAVPFEHPFEVFWLWDVLEHSANPQKMLETITAKASAGSWLFLHTSNAESLTHALFQEDWEGFSDYSHYGVRRITATNLPLWLTDLGWNIVEWYCGDVWVPAGDPVVWRLMEAFYAIPELVVLLSERNLGDFIRVVARKRPGPE